MHRALEWIVYWLVRVLHFPQSWEPKTRGPLQLHDAPFSFRMAVTLAALQLQDEHLDLDEMARLWSGAASRQPGSLVGYGDVLRFGRQVLAACRSTP